MKRITESIAKLCVTAIFISAALFSFQAGEKVNKTSAGLAIKGYDAVAYFEDGKPVKGTQAYQFQWKGATWRFSSAGHRETFAKNPDRYAPQYGGFCAYGVSERHKAPIDPEAWTIIDGKLYLNYDQQVREDWRKDTKVRIQKADQNWPKLAGK
jgi:YHS domain-containing protein